MQLPRCPPSTPVVCSLCRGHRLVDAAVFEAIPFRSAIADGCTHVLVLNNLPKVRSWVDSWVPAAWAEACGNRARMRSHCGMQLPPALTMVPTSSAWKPKPLPVALLPTAGGARDVQRLAGGAGRGRADCGGGRLWHSVACPSPPHWSPAGLLLDLVAPDCSLLAASWKVLPWAAA